MGQTQKRNYDRYTLEFKLQAVKLANLPSVMAKDIAEGLGIHPVMLYRWQMEYRNNELKANKNMKKKPTAPKRRPSQTDPAAQKEDELRKALKKIKKLERELENKGEELDLLKKAERFFADRTKK
jgi:transposase